MAEAFLQVVLDNLSSLVREEIGLILGVNEEMQKLFSTLTTIQKVLEYAELNQIEKPLIQDWLRKLNLLAYEIDDILDDCNTHFSKLKHHGSTLSRYSLKQVLYRSKIGRRMKQVTKRLDDVAAERTKLHLQEMPVDRPREVAAWRETGSMLKEPDMVFGRDEDREKIVKTLVEDVSERQQISVLPITGVGGLGKTTLAQLVFNDPRIESHFDLRIWVCVSDNFDVKTLVKATIESATGTGMASDLQHLDALQRRLCELLGQKRYLLVLDDVWNDQQEKWFELKDILSRGSTSASIIVTTRLKMVAEIMGTLPAHCLEGLSEEHCWMLLQQRAFGQQEEVAPTLEIIGKQIVKKCGGVPLAAKALGGILRFKRTEKEWEYVRDSELLKLSAEESLIMPALRLSYHHLPLELRQCFAYFAAFPKDDRVEKEELIHLWMAHGLISSKGTLQVEDVGNEICNELVLRSLLQPCVDEDSKSMEMSMHDLVHDLAQSVMENKVPGIQTQRNITSSVSTIRQVNLRKRSVLFPKTFQADMSISSIMELASLRVLDASRTGIKDLPPSVGNLKHLRYLNLSYSEIRTLPNSLCALWNLEILNLDWCDRLVALPKKMRYLQNLQHLCLSKCDALCEMPSKMRELSKLKTLSKFIVGHNKGNHLEELQCLNLSGSLEIQHLERVRDHEDAKKANIAEKKNLRELSLSWERKSLSKLGEEEVDEKVLEALEPHPNLEKLSIIGFSGRYFPAWLTNSTLGNMVKIKIMDCRNCRRLPNLGELPHLKSLLLRDLVVEEYLIEEEEEVESGNPVKKIQFPALEQLKLEDLPNLKGLTEEQESKEAFPNLKRLKIKGCSSFILPPISSLEDLECSSSSLPLLSELGSLTLTSLGVMIEEKMTCFPIGMLVKFSNLRSLKISGAKEISVPGEGLQLQALNKLESLTIQHCKTMRCIPEGLLRHLTALKELKIWFCSELVELPEEIKHLHNLEFIHLFGLPKMVCLPEALQHLSSLRRLYLGSLPSLESLPDCLHQLAYLMINDCAKVVSLPAAIPNLKVLIVTECPELERRCQRGRGTESEWHKNWSDGEVWHGGEFRMAYQEAMQYGGKVILGDVPTEITRRRILANMSAWQYLFHPENVLIPEEDLLKTAKDDIDRDNLYVQEFTKKFPSFWIPFMHERDQYMATNILKVAREHNSVVAVVGSSHLAGIEKNWERPVDIKQLLDIGKHTPTMGKMISTFLAMKFYLSLSSCQRDRIKKFLSKIL